LQVDVILREPEDDDRLALRKIHDFGDAVLFRIRIHVKDLDLATGEQVSAFWDSL
jgi:hypothetical protein